MFQCRRCQPLLEVRVAFLGESENKNRKRARLDRRGSQEKPIIDTENVSGNKEVEEKKRRVGRQPPHVPVQAMPTPPWSSRSLSRGRDPKI